MKRLILFALCLLAALPVLADDNVGSVAKYSGKVAIFEGNSPRGTDITAPNTPLTLTNKVATKRTSTALIMMNSGDKIALAENAVVSFSSTNKYNPQAGKVVFSIKKRGAESGLTVGLTTAVIGVKGTEFLVDMTEDGKCKVYLKEGSISVDSTQGDFTKHKAIEMDEYEAYVKKMTGEYDAYIEELQKDYTEYVKSFTMTSGQAISIEGSEVNDVPFDQQTIDAFNLLDQ